MGDLNQRWADLERQIRDNGVTYNVVAHDGTQQRPWLLGLFPLIIPAQSWQQMEAGVTQLAHLLEQVMADVYGPQQLLAQGLLPPALVLGHPGYLRALHGVQPVGGRHLHMVALDLGHGPDGNWRLVSQHTQAPSGLGYLLENRLAVSRQFPQAFAHLQVQHLAGTYRALMNSLQAQSPAGQDAHIALLTPGPYSASYFEHAYLARYLDVSLVEGSDLVVRDQGLFVKTLHGLVPVHGLLNRLDDAFLDPLELRADSTLGVPGLLQVMRAGKVLVANAPGSAFLESAALLDFFPALSKHLLGAELQMSAQFDMPLSQMPTWQPDTDGTGTNNAAPIAPRSVMLRVFAVSDGAQGWRVLPGGLAQVAGDRPEVASLQRGGSSADVWALSDGAVDKTSPAPRAAPTQAPRQQLVTSRAAENLFWLGRYTERAENSVRLASIALDALHGEDPSCLPLLTWVGTLAALNTLVMPGVPLPTPDVPTRRVFERALLNALDSDQTTSVGYNLRALRLAGAAVRDRLSQEHWGLMQRTEDRFFQRRSEPLSNTEDAAAQALATLKATSDHLTAITSLQATLMAHDDGWRLLRMGRHIERMGFLSNALRCGFETGSVHHNGGFDAMVALFDSTAAFHAQYPHRHDVAALLGQLVLDRDNPHALAGVAQALREPMPRLRANVPDPAQWQLAPLCEPGFDANYPALHQLLHDCSGAAYQLSQDIGATYFTHSVASDHSLIA